MMKGPYSDSFIDIVKLFISIYIQYDAYMRVYLVYVHDNFNITFIIQLYNCFTKIPFHILHELSLIYI